MYCNFIKKQVENDLEVKIGEVVTPHVSMFKYLELILQNDREINKYVSMSHTR